MHVHNASTKVVHVFDILALHIGEQEIWKTTYFLINYANYNFKYTIPKRHKHTKVLQHKLKG